MKKCFIVYHEEDTCLNGNLEKIIDGIYEGEPNEEILTKIALDFYNEMNDNELDNDELLLTGLIDIYDDAFIFDVDHDSREYKIEIYDLNQVS